MNSRIQHLIKNPFEVQLSDVALLQDEIDKYPYFPTLRTLLLFGLKEFDHSTYQEELKKTSIHCPSRVALYHYLQREKQNSTEFENEEIVIEQTAPFNPSEEIVSEIDAEEIETNSVETIDTIETEFVPVEENEEILTEKVEESTEQIDVAHSEFTFSQWLSLSKTKTEEAEKTPSEKDIKFQLIDEFIEKAPKISPVSKTQELNSVSKKPETSTEYSDLMTETLAQIYTEQKKYDKAIRAYKILLLKYPDKKGFFEDKISEIEEFMDSK